MIADGKVKGTVHPNSTLVRDEIPEEKKSNTVDRLYILLLVLEIFNFKA